MRLCIIYNFAQHYRTSIFKLIDSEYRTDFVFGDANGDIKTMDYSVLKGDVTISHTINLFGGFYYQKGVVSKLFSDYDAYILLGETRALSTWLFLLLSKLFPNKKVFLWSHGWYGKETLVESFIKKIYFKLPNQGVFLYGNYARRLMIEKGFNENKLYVIHNSLAYDTQLRIRNKLSPSEIYKNHFQNDNKTLIFIGRLTKVKKLHLLIESLYELDKIGEEYNLVLVGTGEEHRNLENLVNSRNLTKKVWFYGASYNEETNAELIYNASLCVAPGNVGLTAMHSMVFGTPVITHDDFRFQMPEFEAIIPGCTGGFFQCDDISSLTQAISMWFSKNGKSREIIRANCYNEIDQSWNPQYQIHVIKSKITNG